MSDRAPLKIPAHLRLDLLKFNRRHRASAQVTLLAVWQLLLHRYSGSDEIAVTTTTDAESVGTEPSLPSSAVCRVVQAHFRSDLTFCELVDQVRAAYVGGHVFTHPGVPGAVSAPHSPESVSSLQNPAEVELALSIFETESGTAGALYFDAELFDDEAAERVTRHYVQLLASALEAPNERVRCLEMVPAREREMLVDRWNDTHAPYPELCVHELIQAQARTAPDAIAVVTEQETLTYRELEDQSERLARRLRSLGAGRGQLVAVCLPRSATLAVSLLAVLKAGAAYVPLDPDYPSERLRTMLEDSGATIVVTAPSVSAGLGPLTAQVLFPSEVLAAAELEPTHGGTRASLGDLAYVIYTSGSTGRPKGVEVTHRGLTNVLHAMRSEPGIAKDDVVHSITTVCFDIFALELFLPLVAGARVVIGSRDTARSPEALRQALLRHGVTVLQATPVTWRMLLDHGWEGTPRLRVWCGGEAMGTDLATRLLQTGAEVWNLYGPTETTIWSAAHRVHCPDDAAKLGRPISNTQLFVTNDELALQPIGVPGELVIGGDGLARGYMNRPELTEERFVVNALGSRGRLYRTGDLAVRLPDGSIRFLGRSDQQVKIRGFRIELGEIEARLGEHPVVRQAVVLVSESTPGQKELVAFWTGDSPTRATDRELREHLKSSLPDYMIPARYVAVDCFPLTHNGKLDRKRLLANLSVADVPIAGDAAPRHDLDRSLQAVWEAVLGRSNVGIDDDFFELGGDSIRALRLVKEMHRATGLEYSPAVLFASPTIRALVDSGAQPSERAASIVKLNLATAGMPIYCLAGVQIYRRFAEHFKEAQVYGVYVKEELAGIDAGLTGATPDVPTRVLVEMYADAVARHATDRRLALAGLSFGGLMALEVAATLKRRGYEIVLAVLVDANPPTAYSRSVTRALADLTRRARSEGAATTMRALGSRFYSKVLDYVRSRHGSLATQQHLAQSKLFEDWTKAYEPLFASYDVDVLLVKAKKQELGLGTRPKHDYGFGRWVTGRLDVTEMDTDHQGMVRGEAAARLYESVAKLCDVR